MRLADVKLAIKGALPKTIVKGLRRLKSHGRRLPTSDVYRNALGSRYGLEVGGPSLLFDTILPVYPVIANLDGANFSCKTMWEGELVEGDSFRYYKNKTGKQFISDATNLSAIGSKAYDFVLSSNCLEHIANPLKALHEWVRVTKPGGYLLLVLPNKRDNFDHKRSVTSFEHILQDYQADVSEYDLTHLPEILELHDLSRDMAAGNLESFAARSADNFSNRALHHHVFDMELIIEMLSHIGAEVIQSDETNSDYFVLGKLIK